MEKAADQLQEDAKELKNKVADKVLGPLKFLKPIAVLLVKLPDTKFLELFQGVDFKTVNISEGKISDTININLSLDLIKVFH